MIYHDMIVPKNIHPQGNKMISTGWSKLLEIPFSSAQVKICKLACNCEEIIVV